MQIDHLPMWGKLTIAATACAACAAMSYGVLMLFGIA
jgi:hypothetical protein